jgi:hypothetical protein
MGRSDVGSRMIVVVHDHAGAGEECKPAAKPPLVLVTAVSTHLSSASRAVKKNFAFHIDRRSCEAASMTLLFDCGASIKLHQCFRIESNVHLA